MNGVFDLNAVYEFYLFLVISMSRCCAVSTPVKGVRVSLGIE